MKSIIYFFFAIIIGCTLTSGLPIHPDKDKIIMLRPAAGNFTSAGLQQSVTIISARLKVYGLKNNEAEAVPGEGQIKVRIPENTALSEVEGLLTMKGDIAFYETYTKREISGLLKGDNQLFGLLDSDPEISPAESKIGCINTDRQDQVNKYLRSIENPGSCKFSWTFLSFSSERSVRCLYALNTGITGKPLLIRSDIENAKAEKEKDSQSFKISITLRKSAAGIWSEATRKNMNRAIAITLDNYVYSAPKVRSVIDKGLCEINGNMTQKEVNYFLALINNEPLPMTLELVK